MKFFISFVFLFCNFYILAQPENDLCLEATEIDAASTNNVFFDIYDLTFDISNGSCAIDAEAGNFWFKFQSQGTYLRFTVLLLNVDAQLSLFQFLDGDCQSDNATEIACGLQEIEVFNLVEGDEYFISVSTVPVIDGLIIFQTENPDTTPPPINNGPCESVSLNSDECINFSLLYADKHEEVPSCANEDLGEVWFKFKQPIGSIGATVEIQSNGDFPSLEMKTILFLDGCTDEFSERSCFVSNGANLSATTNELTSNFSYFYAVYGDNALEDSLNICFEPIFPEENDRSCDAIQIEHNESISGDTGNSFIDIVQWQLPCVYDTRHLLWYKLKNKHLLPSTYKLELSNTYFEKEGFWAIGYFENDCSDTLSIFDHFCGVISDELITYYADSSDTLKDYYFVIGSQSDSKGQFNLDYSLELEYDIPLPANDTLCQAKLLTNEISFVNTFYSSKDIIDTCSDNQSTLWFKVDAALDSYNTDGFISYSVQTGSYSHLSISVGYINGTCSEDNYIDIIKFCNLSQSGILEFPLQAGISEYYIKLSSKELETVNVELSFNLRSPNDNACGAFEIMLNETAEINAKYTYPDMEICSDFKNSSWAVANLELTDFNTIGVFEYRSANLDRKVAVGYFPDDCTSNNFIIIEEDCESISGQWKSIVFDLIPDIEQYYFVYQSSRLYFDYCFVKVQVNRSNDFVCNATNFLLYNWVNGRLDYSTPDIETCNSTYNSVWYKTEIIHNQNHPTIEIEFESNPQLNNISSMTIGYFIEGCEIEDFVELVEICDDTGSTTASFNSVEGISEYYVVLATSDQFSNKYLNFRLFGPQGNNGPCKAEPLKLDTGNPANTSYLDPTLELCNTLLNDQWFYHDVNFPDSSLGAEIIVNPEKINASLQGNLAIGYFDSTCANEFIIIGQICDFNSSERLQLELPNGIERFYIQFSSNGNIEDIFNIYFRPFFCKSPDEYLNAEEIFLNNNCYTGCNVLSQADSTLISCGRENHGVSWYSFDNQSPSRISLYIKNASFPNPVIQAFHIDSTGQFIALTDCVSGGNGRAAIQNFVFPSPDTIYIAVSNGAGGPGFFELCTIDRSTNSTCVEDELYVISTSKGSNFSGPYKPGETVEFCYIVNAYSNIEKECQRIQGIIPVFGDCWDPDSFDSSQKPIVTEQIQAFADDVIWKWYDDVTYNFATNQLTLGDFDGNGKLDMCTFEELACSNEGISQNDTLPPGWFATIDPSGSDPNIQPNNSLGDGISCDTIIGPWTVCFTLKTRFTNTLDHYDCDVKMYITNDAETGDWSGDLASTCLDDFPALGCFSLQCLDGPEIISNDTFYACSGENLFINLETSAPYEYINWRSEYENLPKSLSVGYNQNFTFKFSNFTNESITIPYYFSLEDEFGCQGPESMVHIKVFPNFEIDLGTIDTVCINEPFILGGNPTINGNINSSFNYDWIPGDIENSSNPSYSIGVPTNIKLIATDENDCSVKDSIDVNVFEKIITIQGNTSFCQTNELQQFQLSETMLENIEWSIGSINSSEQTFMLNTEELTLGKQLLEVSFTDKNDCFTTIVIELDIFPTDTIDLNYIGDTLFLCNQPNFQLFDKNKVQGSFYKWLTPNDSIETDTLIISSPGQYKVECINNFNCSSFFDFYVQSGVPSSIKFDGDSILCPGEMGVVTTEFEYETYLWDNNSTDSFINVGPGIYYLTVSDQNNCEITDSIEIIESDSVTIQIIAPDSLCQGEFAEISTSQDFEEYLWSTGDTSKIILVNPGEYSLTITDFNNCSYESIFSIYEKNTPNADFDYIQEELTYTFNNLSINSSSYLWDFGDNETSTEVNPVHTYNQDGIYTISLISSTEFCQDTNSTTIDIVVSTESYSVQSPFQIYPNPSNGSLTIDFFNKIDQSCDITIYNQLGTVVHFSSLQSSNGISTLQTNLSAGIYLIQVETVNQKNIVKMIIL